MHTSEYKSTTDMIRVIIDRIAHKEVFRICFNSIIYLLFSIYYSYDFVRNKLHSLFLTITVIYPTQLLQFAYIHLRQSTCRRYVIILTSFRSEKACFSFFSEIN